MLDLLTSKQADFDMLL